MSNSLSERRERDAACIGVYTGDTVEQSRRQDTCPGGACMILGGGGGCYSSI